MLTQVAVVDLSLYIAAITDIIAGIAAAVPTIMVAVGAVAAGVLVLTVGFRFIRKFVK